MQSRTNSTSLASKLPSFSADGSREYFGSGPPLGRPRCDMRISRPSRSSTLLIVGNAWTIRRSSLILPLAIGTVKSTRSRTRLPLTSMSATVFFGHV